jgi:hypothetical protein
LYLAVPVAVMAVMTRMVITAVGAYANDDLRICGLRHEASEHHDHEESDKPTSETMHEVFSQN